MVKNLPRIAITMGDPAGIGPEIIAKALARGDIMSFCQPLIIGSASLFRQVLQVLQLNVVLSITKEIARTPGSGVIFLDRGHPESEIISGQASKAGGSASLDYIRTAVELTRSGLAGAMVTAPINKEAIRQAGSSFPGHTELLAYLTGVKKIAMMLTSGKLRVVLATTHVALNQVGVRLTAEDIFDKIYLSHQFMVHFGMSQPRIGVASLNPHAGEHGLFGQEEEQIIKPAVEKALQEKMYVHGPLPADTLFYKALHGEFDLIVAMYHDQGLIPIKMTAFRKAVNVTLGLPIIRTSVDHGTAYDIAGKGIADPASLEEAVKLAAVLIQKGFGN